MLPQNSELHHYNCGQSSCPFALLTFTAFSPFSLRQLSLCPFLFSSCSVPIVGPHLISSSLPYGSQYKEMVSKANPNSTLCAATRRGRSAAEAGRCLKK